MSKRKQAEEPAIKPQAERKAEMKIYMIGDNHVHANIEPNPSQRTAIKLAIKEGIYSGFIKLEEGRSLRWFA